MSKILEYDKRRGILRLQAALGILILNDYTSFFIRGVVANELETNLNELETNLNELEVETNLKVN